MIFFDIETLGTESTSVILSIGAVYVEDNSPRSWDDLLKNSIFVKFNAKEQVERYNRVMLKSTLDWWYKQGKFQQETNLKPGPSDLTAVAGLTEFHKWVRKIPNWKEQLIWIRGSLDQVCYESLCRAVEIEPVLPYNQYRDVRTALQILYPDHEKNGYIEVDTTKCIGYHRDKVAKHHPAFDAAMDAAMLLYPLLDDNENVV